MASLRQLFLPGAVIVKEAAGEAVAMTVDAFIPPRGALLTSGVLTEFHEWEVASHTAVFGGMAWRQCRYRKSGVQNGNPFEGAGVKALTFARQHDTWKIASVTWQDEEEGLALPPEFSF